MRRLPRVQRFGSLPVDVKGESRRVGLAHRADQRLQGRFELVSFQGFGLEADNEIAHIADHGVQIGYRSGQARLGLGWGLLDQVAALLQPQSNGVNGLNDPVVQIAAQLHPFPQRTAQPHFAFLERFFHPLALGHIPGNSPHARGARHRLQSHTHAKHHATPVFCPDLEFDGSTAPSGFELAQDRAKRIAVCGRDQLRDVQSGGFLVRVAQDLFARFVEGDQVPLEVVGENDVMGVFKQLPIMFLERRLALTDRFRPLRDVPPDHAHPDNSDQHERRQQEQRPEQIRQLRRGGGLRGRLCQGPARNQEHRRRRARKKPPVCPAAQVSV